MENITQDEGYTESELPQFLKGWTEEQKADLALQLLLKMQPSTLGLIQTKLKPYLHRNFMTLPYELATKILGYCDEKSLKNSELVSHLWHALIREEKIWHQLIINNKWTLNDSYLKFYQNHLVKNASASSNSLGLILDNNVQFWDTGSLIRLKSSADMEKRNSESKIRQRLAQRNMAKMAMTQPSTPLNNNFGVPMSPSYSHHPNSLLNSPLQELDNKDSLAEELLNLDLNAQPSSSTPPLPSIPNINIRQSTLERNRPSPLDLNLTISFNGINSALNTGLMSNYSIEEMNTPLIESLHHSPVENGFALSPISRAYSEISSIKSPTITEHQFEKDIKRDYNFLLTYHNKKINYRRLFENKKKMEHNWTHILYDKYELQGHEEGIYCLQFDRHYLFSGSRDDTIKQWDLETRKCTLTYRGHQASVLCLQYDDQLLISGSSDSFVIVWDRHTGAILQKIEEHMDSVLNLAFDSNYLVTCSKDRSIKVFKRNHNHFTLIGTLNGHRVAVNAVSFKGDLIVSASGDRTLKIWSLKTGKCLNTLHGHTRGIASLYFGDNLIISGSSDKTIKLWSLQGELLHTLEGHDDLVRTLDVTSKYIISGSYDKTIKIWCKFSYTLIKTIEHHQHRVFKVVSNEEKIISCSQDPNIMVLDFTYNLDTTFLV